MFRGTDNKVAVVTGGGSGIGAAICAELARHGGRVGVLDRDLRAAEVVAESIVQDGGQAHPLWCDVSDPGSVDTSVREVVKRWGQLDIAINNAGTGLPATKTADLTDADWRRIININLDGVFYCMRAELRHMESQRSGSIVNVASIMGAVGTEHGNSAYAASKHAVVGLTKNAALEYASHGIRINAVGPGYVRTPLVEASLTDAAREERTAKTPLGRLAEPEEIASVVLWLASDQATYVTGSFVVADGGFTAG